MTDAGGSPTQTEGGVPGTSSGRDRGIVHLGDDRPGRFDGPDLAGQRAGSSRRLPRLCCEQDGAAVALALVFAGSKGGVVLGVPGLTLLRSGDRFTRLVRLYAPDKQQALAAAFSKPDVNAGEPVWKGLPMAGDG